MVTVTLGWNSADLLSGKVAELVKAHPELTSLKAFYDALAVTMETDISLKVDDDWNEGNEQCD